MGLENAASHRDHIACVDHAQDRFIGGGARLGLQAGSRRSSFFIGSPPL
jgi:hypothetical protein